MGHGLGLVFLFFFFSFGVHANCPNFVPLKMKIRERNKEKRNKEGYQNITN